MSRLSDAIDAGFDPTPAELAADPLREPGRRTYRGPRGPVPVQVTEPWADEHSTRAERMWAGEAS